MKWTLVRYRTRSEKAEENALLIGKVFEELKARSPAGLRYVALRLPDGAFLHLVTTEEGAASVSTLESFRAFQSGIKERCLELPEFNEVSIVGNYRML
jgi:hypothetical protein